MRPCGALGAVGEEFSLVFNRLKRMVGYVSVGLNSVHNCLFVPSAWLNLDFTLRARDVRFRGGYPTCLSFGQSGRSLSGSCSYLRQLRFEQTRIPGLPTVVHLPLPTQSEN